MSQLPDLHTDMETPDEPKSLSLLGGIARPEPTEAERFEMADEAGKTTRSRNQLSLVIVVTAVVAAGVIYAMRLSQTKWKPDPSAKQAQAQVEQALAKLTQPARLNPNDPLRKSNLDALFRNTDAIVAMFASENTQRQVPVNYVKKNPFAFSEPVQGTSGGYQPDAAQIHAANVARLKVELKHFTLQSIVDGRIPVAVIDGKFARPGDKIGSFIVKSINAKQLSVTLVNGADQFTLSMQSGNLGG